MLTELKPINHPALGYWGNPEEGEREAFSRFWHHEAVVTRQAYYCSDCKKTFAMLWPINSCQEHFGNESLYN